MQHSPARAANSSSFLFMRGIKTYTVLYCFLHCLDIEGLCFYEGGWRLPDTGKEQFQPWLLKVGQAC